MITKIKFQSKKGQVAATINWVVAFLVIFFIMLIYLGGVAMFASGKKVSSLVGGEGINEINIDSSKNGGSLEIQRKLEYLLNSPVVAVEGETDIRGLIALWSEDNERHENFLEDKLKILLNEIEYEEYDDRFENEKVIGFNFRIRDKKFVKTESFPIEFFNTKSNNFMSGYCYYCGDAYGVYVPIENTKTVYVFLSASRRAK